MLGTADPTPYDLRFRVLGIPVRVSPWFWLIMLMLSGDQSGLAGPVTFVLCAFVSLLAHELGHGLSSRLLGVEPTEIVLYGLGGYCAYPFWQRSALRRIIVLVCGPLAGFVLFGLAAGAWVVSQAYVVEFLQTPIAKRVLFYLMEINLVWGVLNLFPIWPLDGGRITENVLGAMNARSGTRWAHVISLLTAGGLALGLASYQQYFMAIWFGYFGFLNYQILQAHHDAYRSAPGRWED